MSKKIKNTSLPKELVRNLNGFEDVFQDYVDNEESKEVERREREKNKFGEHYELQYFLEQENARLTGLENFLTKKIPLKTNFSQTEKLIKLQKENKRILKERLVKEVKKLDSNLQKNLGQFFNSHFS